AVRLARQHDLSRGERHRLTVHVDRADEALTREDDRTARTVQPLEAARGPECERRAEELQHGTGPALFRLDALLAERRRHRQPRRPGREAEPGRLRRPRDRDAAAVTAEALAARAEEDRVLALLGRELDFLQPELLSLVDERSSR